jgi:uncharacterized protein (TIGR03435 family)
MNSSDWKRLTVAILGLIVPFVARSEDAVKRFDTVAIHAVPPDAPNLSRPVGFSPIYPNGRFSDPRIPLSTMIGLAYDVHNGADVVGLPKWAENTSYSITAKAGEDFSAESPEDNVAQIRLMMRTMLSDRFHLQVQTETRDQKGLMLEVGPGGLKINEVSAPIPPEKEGYAFGNAWKDGGGRITGTKATMVGLARSLTMTLGQPVVDRTGLTGYYDLDLKWPGDDQESAATFGSPAFVAGALQTLREKLGLRITTTTVSVTTWRVTHVEPPTEN